MSKGVLHLQNHFQENRKKPTHPQTRARKNRMPHLGFSRAKFIHIYILTLNIHTYL